MSYCLVRHWRLQERDHIASTDTERYWGEDKSPCHTLEDMGEMSHRKDSGRYGREVKMSVQALGGVRERSHCMVIHWEIRKRGQNVCSGTGRCEGERIA